MSTKLEQFRAHKPRKTNYEKVFCVARREKSSYSVETGIKQREALETHTPSILLPLFSLEESFQTLISIILSCIYLVFT